jgi:hypothetical protein
MCRGNSPEGAQMMHALGAEVVLVGQARGSPPGQASGGDLKLVEVRAQEITKRALRSEQTSLLVPGTGTRTLTQPALKSLSKLTA